jgi:ABC-type Fe3+-hydroxamate transport system substrate-binding protein
MRKIKSIIGAIAVVVVLSGCSSVGSSAMNASVGSAIDMVGTLLDKPLEISDSMKGKVTFENAKWRQVTGDQVSYGFIMKSNKTCKAVSIEGKAYIGNVVFGSYVAMMNNVKTNEKYVISETLMPTEKRFIDRMTIDVFTCF